MPQGFGTHEVSREFLICMQVHYRRVSTVTIDSQKLHRKLQRKWHANAHRSWVHAPLPRTNAHRYLYLYKPPKLPSRSSNFQRASRHAENTSQLGASGSASHKTFEIARKLCRGRTFSPRSVHPLVAASPRCLGTQDGVPEGRTRKINKSKSSRSRRSRA